MNELVRYLVRTIVARPDAVKVSEVEGEACILLELAVDPADVDTVKGPDGETLRAIRTVLSAAAGRRKAVLELVEPEAAGAAAGEE